MYEQNLEVSELMPPAATAASKGHHVIIDLEGLAKGKCIDSGIWERSFTLLSVLMNVRVISRHSHVFEPPSAPGLTSFFLLDASHLSVHTYADEGKAAIDLFSCTHFVDTMIVKELLGSLGIHQENISFRTTVQRFGHGGTQAA